MNSPIKALRFLSLYGLGRTVAKVVSRLEINFPLWLYLKFPFFDFSGQRVGIIGCGHHSFSTIAFFILKHTNAKIVACLDKDLAAAERLATAYNCRAFQNKKEFFKQNLDLVYVVSNHASHVPYALEAIRLDLTTYIEKPIAVDHAQLQSLKQAFVAKQDKLFVGYNRPCAPLVKNIINEFDATKPFTLNCFIVGHVLPVTHWYRDPKEGSRILGNLAHWIDLFTFFLSLRPELPNSQNILISFSDEKFPSDNISITMKSSAGDLLCLTFSTRGELFEGVNETVLFHQEPQFVKIDDFRKISFLKNSSVGHKTNLGKDVGHKNAVLQPFRPKRIQTSEQIFYSADLILFVEKMLTDRSVSATFGAEN